MARRLSDWLKAWMQFVEMTEAPELFRPWVGAGIIAAALQRRCHLIWRGPLYANMYIVLVGPSGVGKGETMGPGLDLLQDVGPIKLAAESITREALIRELRKANVTEPNPETGEVKMHSSLTIYAPELAVFLGYSNLALLSDLTDWYDCRSSWTYRTKHQGTDVIEGVWVNMIGGTTPDLIRTALPRDAIGGGLTGRMIFVYGARKSKIITMPEPVDVELRDALLEDLQYLAGIRGVFTFSDDYIERLTTWYIDHCKHPPFRDDPDFIGYVSRRRTHLLKLSMVMSISSSDDMILTAENFDISLKLLTQTERYMRNVYMAYGKQDPEDVLPKVMARVSHVKEILYSKLLSEFRGVMVDDMRRIIQTMSEMKLCKVSVDKKSGDAIIRHIPKEKEPSDPDETEEQI